MKRTARARWSFVLLRGADKTVRQFQFSKRSVVAAPAAAVLAVSGCIAGVQLKSQLKINHLEDQLSEQSSQLSQNTAKKEEAIAALQREINRLSNQSKELAAKANDLQALETKLQQFIEKYGALTSSADPAGALGKSSADLKVKALSASSDGDGYTASPSPEMKLMAALANGSSLDLEALNEMVDAMEQTMAHSFRLAQQRQAELDAIPSGWPTTSRTMTSGFGYRKDPFTGKAIFHAGIDIAGESGDPVFSAANGEVIESGYSSSEGNYVVVDHGNGLCSVYMHLKQIEAREGETVVRGEKIGLLGSTGRSTGPHLHFQIMQSDKAVNPLPYLKLAK
ncbi:M23 family metallopeptidase [Paenibacillus sp. NEAU-GSW1]|uniref:M23 family metallopeptidase n=1 Tax=Paenibacillus sp. NEAU-GSW1 TaxID=2682486 RepID=UPI0012E26E10|nr:M23 family metallopeptidase [Paenibacillus sp. NEAU-GSW1]MUT67644.1 peptidoglycan DD-metalloendopeptidase family protein [Paenibacillus sp. NEAU-GSW1]